MRLKCEGGARPAADRPLNVVLGSANTTENINPALAAQRLARRYRGEAITLSGASSFAAEALAAHFAGIAGRCA